MAQQGGYDAFLTECRDLCAGGVVAHCLRGYAPLTPGVCAANGVPPPSGC